MFVVGNSKYVYHRTIEGGNKNPLNISRICFSINVAISPQKMNKHTKGMIIRMYWGAVITPLICTILFISSQHSTPDSSGMFDRDQLLDKFDKNNNY